MPLRLVRVRRPRRALELYAAEVDGDAVSPHHDQGRVGMSRRQLVGPGSEPGRAVITMPGCGVTIAA